MQEVVKQMKDSREINQYTVVGFSEDIQKCVQKSLESCGKEVVRIVFESIPDGADSSDPLAGTGLNTRTVDVQLIPTPWQSGENGAPSFFGTTPEGSGVRVAFPENGDGDVPPKLEIVEPAPFDDPKASY